MNHFSFCFAAGEAAHQAGGKPICPKKRPPADKSVVSFLYERRQSGRFLFQDLAAADEALRIFQETCPDASMQQHAQSQR